MSDLISPMPNGVLPGSSYWNDWVEKLRTLVNGLLTQISWANISGTPTTLAGYGITDPVELTTHKDAASGYAGLDANSRTTKGVKTTDDLIVDNAVKGLVLKSPNGHYWRFTISNAGIAATTDLGTTSP
jgi:hypothetical protein